MSSQKIWAIEQLDGETWQRVMLLPTYLDPRFEKTTAEARQTLHEIVAANAHLPWRPVEITVHPDGAQTTEVLTADPGPPAGATSG